MLLTTYCMVRVPTTKFIRMPLQVGARQTCRAENNGNKGPIPPVNNEPDIWDSPIWGYVWKVGYGAVVVGAIAFLLNLAFPVIQTMEDRFPKASVMSLNPHFVNEG